MRSDGGTLNEPEAGCTSPRADARRVMDDERTTTNGPCPGLIALVCE